MQLSHLIFCLGVSSTGTLFAQECPSDSLKSLDTTFHGVMTVLSPSGEVQSVVRVSETHTVINCDEYTAKIVYRDNAGNVTREMDFEGEWNANEKLFKIHGANINGTFRVVKADTFFVTFETNFATGKASCDELISVTNQGKELSRTLHCFAGGQGGPSLGTRAVQSSSH